MAQKFRCNGCGQFVEERTRMNYYLRYEVVVVEGKSCRGERVTEGGGFAEGFGEDECHDAFYCGCGLYDSEQLEEAVRDGSVVIVEEGEAGAG